jgi:predicted ArsR family transcriptional regulator
VTADRAIRAVAVLDDDLRQRMYAFIREAGRPVTRDEAAESVGISRKLAAFHLDKLVDAGVLKAGYGSSGPRRVGRAPKVYQPSEVDIRVAIPPREHDLLAELLLDAVVHARSGETPRAATLRIARDRGRQIGAAERSELRPGRLGAERGLTLAGSLLQRHGFEPRRESATRLRLRNCPFHPLASQAPNVVCGMNQALLAGVLEGLDAPGLQAVLDPRPGECCVQLQAADQ